MTGGGSSTPSKVPDFLVIGAQKAGTTSLHAYLQQIPELFLPERKEPHFFCSPGGGRWPSWTDEHRNERYRGIVLDPDDYAALFTGAETRLCGESSTNYLTDPDVPARIAAVQPEMKLIALLREPAERAFSCWKMWRRAGIEPLSFPEALAAEAARDEANVGPAITYLGTGRYASHLETWETSFPPSQILLLETARFDRDPYGVVAEILVFLGVGSENVATIDIDRRNVGDVGPRSYAANSFVRHNPLADLGRAVLPDPIRRKLGSLIKRANTTPAPTIDAPTASLIRQTLLDETERLEQRTGWDLGSWKDVHGSD